MINISATIAGTIAASGEEFTLPAKTPVPLYVNGAWWAFQQEERPTAPKFGIISRKSTDNGVTWAEDSKDYFTLRPSSVEEIFNGPAFGSSLLAATTTAGNFGDIMYKDLDTPASSWIEVDTFSEVPPLSKSKSSPKVSYDSFNSKFIINFLNISTAPQHWHFVTTTDFVTYVDAGPSDFGVGGSGANFELFGIVHLHTDGSGLHIAHVKEHGSSGNSFFSTYTSSDFVTWTQVVNGSDFFNFRDIRYFKGKWLGVRDLSLNNVNNPAFFLYTSTDLLAWDLVDIDRSDEDLVLSPFQAKDIVATKDRVAYIDDGELVETTDGIIFTAIKNEQRLAPDVTVFTLELGAAFKSLDFNVKGKYINDSTVDGPTVALQATVSHEDQGGKLLSWSGSLVVKPSLAFNPSGDTHGAIVGFTGDANHNGTGIADGGFSIHGTEATFFFDSYLNYMFNDGIRQWEATITEGTDFLLGMRFLVSEQGTFGNTQVLLSNGPSQLVSTHTNNTPVSFGDYDGMTIGVVHNIPAGTIQFYVDGVLIIDFTPVLTGATMWAPYIDVLQSPKVSVNIGQDTFKFPIAGTIPWANEYL